MRDRRGQIWKLNLVHHKGQTAWGREAREKRQQQPRAVTEEGTMWPEWKSVSGLQDSG